MDYPSFKEEIERKTLEELQRLMFDYEKAKLSRSEAAQCLRTLWNAVSGLIERETMELIARGIKDVETKVLATPFDDVTVLTDPANGRLFIALQRRSAFVIVAGTLATPLKKHVTVGDGTFPEQLARTQMIGFKSHFGNLTKEI